MFLLIVGDLKQLVCSLRHDHTVSLTIYCSLSSRAIYFRSGVIVVAANIPPPLNSTIFNLSSNDSTTTQSPQGDEMVCLS